MSIHTLHPEGQPLSWQERLDDACTERDVVAVTREFLATVTPYEIARLPDPLRPRKISDSTDITTYAFELVRGDCEDLDGAQPALHRLAHFFSSASMRLSRIMACHPDTQPGRGLERRAWFGKQTSPG